MTDIEKDVAGAMDLAMKWASHPFSTKNRVALEAAIRALAVRGEPVGFVMVPSGPTREMLNAAIDVDSFKLGDISPLGFRCSPQQLFERCYRAMLAAAPKETL